MPATTATTITSSLNVNVHQLLAPLCAAVGLDPNSRRQHFGQRAVLATVSAVTHPDAEPQALSLILRSHPFVVGLFASFARSYAALYSDPDFVPREDYGPRYSAAHRPTGALTFERTEGLPTLTPPRIVNDLTEAGLALFGCRERPGVQVPLLPTVPSMLNTEQVTGYLLLLTLSRGDARLSINGLLHRDPFFLTVMAELLLLVAEHESAAIPPDSESESPLKAWCDQWGTHSLAWHRTQRDLEEPADASNFSWPTVVE